MTKEEMKKLKHYDGRIMASLSLNERAKYIMLLNKLRNEVQLSLEILK